MILTTKKFAELNDMDYPSAKGVIDHMLKLGLVHIIGKEKSSSGKGKPSVLYEIPETATMTFKVCEDLASTQNSQLDLDKIENWLGNSESGVAQ